MSNSQEKIAQEAAEWVVLLSTQDITLQQFEQLELWQQKSPEHALAFERLQHLINDLQMLKDQHIQSDHPVVQQHVFARKSRLSGYYSTLILLACIGCLFYQLPWQNWFADVKNQSSDWQEHQLSDNSQVKLAGKTHLNIKFDQQIRTIELLEGNILVDVAHDPKRPFIVDVGGTKIQALGTRFIVRHYGQQTFVSMLESKTKIAVEQQRPFTLNTGESLILQDDHPSVKQENAATLQLAWDSKKLAVNHVPLSQVLDILESYDSGYYVYDAQSLRQLNVTAVLPLDQPAVALQILCDHLKLKVSRYSPLVTRIEKI